MRNWIHIFLLTCNLVVFFFHLLGNCNCALLCLGSISELGNFFPYEFFHCVNYLASLKWKELCIDIWIKNINWSITQIQILHKIRLMFYLFYCFIYLTVLYILLFYFITDQFSFKYSKRGIRFCIQKFCEI